MKHITKIAFCIICLLATGMWLSEDILAQRGRGRGGVSRGGNRNSRAGLGGGGRRPSVGRSPSMGRPTTGRPAIGRPAIGRPATGRPATGRPTTGRPSQGQLNDFLNLGGRDSRPETRPGGSAAGYFLQNRPAQVPSTGNRPSGGSPIGNDINIGIRNQSSAASHRPGHRPPGARPPGYRSPGNRPLGYRPPGYRAPHIRHMPHYGAGYWARHTGYRWGWYKHDYNWWKWATAASMTGWVVGGIGQPVYYSYGDNLYYEGDNVYYNNEVVATSAEYAAQAQTIASNVPDVAADEVEWMPLGIFALTQKDEESVEDSTLFLQLAISKEGIVAGTFQNTATDKSFEVQGSIDTESQRAAWGPVGEDWPIMESGIYNLSENEAGALLHFADGQTQEWSMIRLDEPAEGDEKNPLRGTRKQ